MTATVALVDDPDVIANFIPAADRPVGQTAFASELGAVFDGEHPVSFEGTPYAIASGLKATALAIEGVYDEALRAQDIDPFDVAAFTAREPEDGSVTGVEELWALAFNGKDGVSLKTDALVRII